MMQIKTRIQSFLALFLPFLGSPTYYPLTGMKYFGLHAFRRRAGKGYISEQQTLGKSRFFIDDLLIVLGSRA